MNVRCVTPACLRAPMPAFAHCEMHFRALMARVYGGQR